MHSQYMIDKSAEYLVGGTQLLCTVSKTRHNYVLYQ